MQLKQLVRKDVLFRYRYIYPLYSVHYLVLLLKKNYKRVTVLLVRIIVNSRCCMILRLFMTNK